MTSDTNTGEAITPNAAADRPAKTRRFVRRSLAAGAVGGALALGAVGLLKAQTVVPTPVPPVAVTALVPSGATAVKGEVAEIFGNKFIVQDATGRALVETGREGEGGGLVSRGDTVTVQGRFEKGFLHAQILIRGYGNVVRLGKAGGPPPGTLDWATREVGLGRQPDVPALTKVVEQAGYSDVRVTGRGPKHLDVAAKNRDGQEWRLHVGFDGSIRERPLI